MKLLLYEKKEIHPQAIKTLLSANITVITHTKLTKDQKNEIEAIFVRTYTKVTKSLLGQFPNLKFILRAGVGIDNIDLQECKKRDIKVINAPGSNANSVAEYVIALMILLLRNFSLQVESLKKGNWRLLSAKGKELKGKTIGLIGCGAIGHLIAEKLIAFKVKQVLGYDPYLDKNTLKKFSIKKTNFTILIKTADIVSLHLPLTPKTRNLISQNELSLMKKESYLINTSRGGIINEKDLIWALRTKKISGVALDVFENEPKVKEEFFSLENVILTPHIAALTKEAELAMCLDPVKKFLKMLK